MKIIKKILLLILLIIPLKVNAASLELTCPTIASSNSKIKCSIKTATSMKGLKILFSLPNVISTDEIETNWTSYYNGKKGLVVTKNDQNDLNSNITFKISEQAVLGTEYNIGLINIEASDNEHKIINIDNVYSKVKIVSDDNNLSNLTITNGSLSPKFNKNKTTYTATVNSEKTTVTAIPASSTAKVAGNIGEIKLNYGINKLNITVTSELGTTRTYTITITRPLPITANTTNNNKTNNNGSSNNNTTTSNNNKTDSSKETNASLNNLKVKGHYIEFSPNKFNYKLKVKNSITSIDITAIPTNSKAKVEIEKPDTLEVGENNITITVTTEGGTICKYQLVVIREKEKNTTSNNNTKTTKENIKSNKKLSIFPSIPLSITIIVILLFLLISFIVIKRIFKEN